jgi:hypothetical protein
MTTGKKIMTGILALIVVAVAAILALAATKPDEFRVTRSALIDAPPSAIYPYLSDLRKGTEWSPWIELDPDMEQSYEGPADQVGGVYKWKGDSNVGEGSLTLTELRPNEFVQMRLDFVKPMEGTSTAEYALTPKGDQTEVSWTMYGENGFMAKIMSVFMDCEKMMSEQFYKGLGNLKAIVEKK